MISAVQQSVKDSDQLIHAMLVRQCLQPEAANIFLYASRRHRGYSAAKYIADETHYIDKILK